MASKPVSSPTLSDAIAAAMAVVGSVRSSLTAESLTASHALEKAISDLGGFERNIVLAQLCAASQAENARAKAARTQGKS